MAAGVGEWILCQVITVAIALIVSLGLAKQRRGTE